MGWFGAFLFGEGDEVLVKEFASLHKLPKDIVEIYFKKMLEDIKNELSTKIED